MPDSPDLHATLADLHRQLESAQQVAPNDRELLARVLGDIERVLAKGPAEGQPTAEPESLVTRLTESARNFEESHPTLFGAVGSVIDALSRMGI